VQVSVEDALASAPSEYIEEQVQASVDGGETSAEENVSKI
jgi:hypothetical protein